MQLNETKHLRVVLKEKCEELQKLKNKCLTCICQDDAKGSSKIEVSKDLESARTNSLTVDKKEQLFEKKIEDEMLDQLDSDFDLQDVNNYAMEGFVEVQQQPKGVITGKTRKKMCRVGKVGD